MLKIEHKPKNSVEFGTLKAGQVFERNDRLLIKLNDGGEDNYLNLMSFDTGIMTSCTMVIPHNATLVVEY